MCQLKGYHLLLQLSVPPPVLFKEIKPLMISRTALPAFHLRSILAAIAFCISGIIALSAQQAAKQATTNTGIRFTDESWKDILKQAKASNKLIFVDCYADWCGPCKYMSKNVFPDEALGKLFNTSFISVKMNMEQDESDLFGATYDVDAYPTLYFINPSGKVVLKQVGAVDAAGLQQLAERAITLQAQLPSFAGTPQTTIAFRDLRWNEVKQAAMREGKLIYIDHNPYDSAAEYLDPFYYDTAIVGLLNREFICWKYADPTDLLQGNSADMLTDDFDVYAENLFLNNDHYGIRHFYSPEGTPVIAWDGRNIADSLRLILGNLKPMQEKALHYPAIYPMIEQYANGERSNSLLKQLYAGLGKVSPEQSGVPLLLRFINGDVELRYYVARQLLESASANDLRNDTVFEAFCSYYAFQEDHKLIVAFADQYNYFSARHPLAAEELAIGLYETSYYHLSEYINKPLARAVRKLTAAAFTGIEETKALAAFDEMIRQTERYYRNEKKQKEFI